MTDRTAPTGPPPAAGGAAGPLRGFPWRGFPRGAAIAPAVAPLTPAARSNLIDRAYDAFCELYEAGLPVDPDEFCTRYPAFQTSLRRLLRVHLDADENPELLRGLRRPWPAPGHDYLGFRLLRELGRGTFARVFLAREAAVGDRLVAVKVSVHADNEAHTLGRLDHPNVVPVLSAQSDPAGGFSVVCMPYLGGATLCDVLDLLSAQPGLPAGAQALLDVARGGREPGDPAPPAARALRRGRYLDGVLHLGERLADALAYVHARGLLHRDLKPSNVLLRPDGEPVLLDFNLALDPDVLDHRAGGTLPYMAPEQLPAMARRDRGTPVPADDRTDLFALGVILYELLAGVHPFGPVPLRLGHEDLCQFLLERQRRGPRPLREWNGEVSPALDALIRRCLAWDPARRPAGAAELAAELRRFRSPLRRAGRWAAAHARAVAAVAAIALVGAGVEARQLLSPPSAPGADPLPGSPGRGSPAAPSGDEYYRDGRFDEAVRSYSEALTADPDQPALHFKRGRAYQQLGDWRSALADYKRANPEGNPKAAACLGYCQARLGEHAEAVERYDRAIRGGFAPAEVHNNKAVSLEKLNDPRGAEMSAAAALQAQPGMAAAHYNHAMAVFKLAGDRLSLVNPAPAVEDIQQVIGRGHASKELFQFAATVCALTLERRSPPVPPERLADDPLYHLGLAYTRRAVETGCPREQLAEPHLLKVWADRLPPDLAVEPSRASDPPRVVDPLQGRLE